MTTQGIVYIIKQFYYGDTLLVEAFTNRITAERKAEELNNDYGDSEHYYEVEAITIALDINDIDMI